MALKAGDNMADFPDYFRALPTQDGTQVALSNYKGARACRQSNARVSAPSLVRANGRALRARLGQARARCVDCVKALLPRRPPAAAARHGNNIRRC